MRVGTMGAGRMVRYAAAAIALAALAPAPADASRKPLSATFNGGCELSGIATFDRPVTNEAADNGGIFRSQPGLGNCVGTLAVGPDVLEGASWTVRARARATGTFSCVAGTLKGAAEMIFLGDDDKALRLRGRRVGLRAEITMTHQVVGGAIEFLGRAGSRAGGVYNFTPSVGAVAGCVEPGDKSLPMAVRMQTFGPFSGL